MSSMRVYDPDTTPLEGTMLLEASAGTGKTYALERMVTRLVSEGSEPMEISSILVVTFTNRAAREMKERIRTLLSERSKDSLRPLSDREYCARALSDFDRASIYTIHGFCQMVLSTWPFESDSPFGQELEPGGTLELEETRTWLAGLNNEEIDSTVLRSAYASAGSVDALVEKLAKEATGEKGYPGTDVLPGLDEMRQFAEFLDSSEASKTLQAAANKLFSRIWTDEGMLAVIKAARGSKSRKDSKSLDLIRQHLAACRRAHGLLEINAALFGDPWSVDIKNHFLDLLKAGVACIRGEAVNPELLDESRESEELVSILGEVFGAMEPYVEVFGGPNGSIESFVERFMYRAFMDPAVVSVRKKVDEKKHAEGRWGYADLIRRVAEAVSSDASALRILLKRRFRAALIDEFQDTDPSQWALFNNLFGDKEHLLALIGDPKQSIYGFRGTGLQAYEAAKNSVSRNSMFRLDTNYRSAPGLVNAVNQLFQPLFTQACEANNPVGFKMVEAGKSSAFGVQGLDSESSILLVDTPDKASGPEVVVREIRKLLGSTGIALKFEPDSDDQKERELSASDIAVLVRNAKQEDAVLEHLASADIPAVRVRSQSVFSRPVTALLQAFLEAMDRPGDIRRWKSLLLGDFFRLPSSLVYQFESDGRLDEYVERGGLWKELFLDGRSTEVLVDFFNYSTILAKWAEESSRSDVADILERPWTNRLLAGREGERHWQDWNHLTEMVQRKQAEGVREPSDINRWMYLSADSMNSEGKDDAVRLETESPAVRVMTMHASKGLEFPFVFLLGDLSGKSRRDQNRNYMFDSDGQLTIDRFSRESNRDVHLAYDWEESKRLWYVAFTRASRALWLVRPDSGPFTPVDSLLAQASGFISGGEIPPHEILDKKGGEALRSGLNDFLVEQSEASNSVLGMPLIRASEIAPLPVTESAEYTLASLPSSNVARRDPATSSYTSLTRSDSGSWHNREGDEKDVDRQSDIPDEIQVTGSGEVTDSDEIILASDRGALFGTLVHALYEETDFGLACSSEELWYGNEKLDDLFRMLAGRHYHTDWYKSRKQALKKLVRTALRAPLPGLGRLCDLGSDDMRAEVEFLTAIPLDARIPVDNREILMPGGYLKGFIDLLVRSNGKWWVLDWKTNVPKDAIYSAEYSQKVLGEMMESHQYHLQYELYLLSLCRTLSSSLGRPVDWENEIGGAAYLFVRGMMEEGDRGIYSRKPDKERMIKMAVASGLEGVLV